MNNDHWDSLIQGHLDDVLNAAERAEFNTLVRESEAARRRFWELAEVHGLARDAARLAWPGEDALAIASPTPRQAWFPSRFANWRPVGLIAAGILLGVLMSGLAWAIVRPDVQPEIELLAEGFESVATTPLPGGLPQQAGVWSGDFTEIIAAQADVQPIGARMLRFLSADYEGKPNPGGYIGEIYRLMDVRDLHATVADDSAVVQASALFNAGSLPAAETYQTSLSIYALDAATVNDGTLNQGTALLDRALAVTRRSKQELDRDTASWQQLVTELRLPANTEFLLLRIAIAHSGSARQARGHEKFAAHYADDIRVSLAHRPLQP